MILSTLKLAQANSLHLCSTTPGLLFLLRPIYFCCHVRFIVVAACGVVDVLIDLFLIARGGIAEKNWQAGERGAPYALGGRAALSLTRAPGPSPPERSTGSPTCPLRVGCARGCGATCAGSRLPAPTFAGRSRSGLTWRISHAWRRV